MMVHFDVELKMNQYAGNTILHISLNKKNYHIEKQNMCFL